MQTYRIGQGYDVHRLVPGRRLILGGVDIAHPVGLLGHSDADVLVHALMDAILGALGEGDIGRHFPDTDARYEGSESIHLLTQVCAIMRARGYEIANADLTVIAQAPKLSPFMDKMRSNIAFALGCDTSAVNVKATTEEHLGFTGREEGIAALAVVLLVAAK